MKVSSNIFDIVILLGAIQGFIISSLLYFKKIYANKLLAALIFFISLACLNIFLMNINIKENSIFWGIFSLVVPLVIVMPLGPLIYFYVQAFCLKDFKLDRTHRIHFYPVLIDLFPGLVGIVFVTGAFTALINKNDFNSWGTFLDYYNTYSDIPRWLSVSIYTWLAWEKLKQFQKTKQPARLAWPKQFVVGLFVFVVIWLLHLIPYEIPSLSSALLDWGGWYPIYIPLVVMIYWLGFNGYLMSRPENLSRSSPLDTSLIADTMKVLNKAMQQDRIYLNPALSLNEVVKHTGVPQKIISAVVNQHLGKSFNEFVNEFRIHEVKKKLLEPGHEHLTITGIAFECGFNSQATFQRTFKLFTNQSPREFQQVHQNSMNKSAQI